jgi:hypothetical protein
MRTRVLNRLLIIGGIVLMILLSLMLGMYVDVDEWYIKVLLYLSIPILFVIWFIGLQIIDIVVLGIINLKGLVDKQDEENNSYIKHLSNTDDDLEFVSKHNAAKYTLLEEKRLKNIEELEQNITLTQSTIDKFTKQLFELESLKKQYEEK